MKETLISYFPSQIARNPQNEKIVNAALKGSPDTKTLYYAITSMANLKIPSKLICLLVRVSLFSLVGTPYVVDKDTVPAALLEAVEKEDTPQSYAYAFLAASVIPDVDLSDLFGSIEDIVAQADEAPSTLYVSSWCNW